MVSGYCEDCQHTFCDDELCSCWCHDSEWDDPSNDELFTESEIEMKHVEVV